MSIFLTLTSAGVPTGSDYEDFVDFVQTVRLYFEEVLRYDPQCQLGSRCTNRSRPARELRPSATADEVFGPSDDPRPHCVEWRTLWTAAREASIFSFESIIAALLRVKTSIGLTSTSLAIP